MKLTILASLASVALAQTAQYKIESIYDVNEACNDDGCPAVMFSGQSGPYAICTKACECVLTVKGIESECVKMNSDIESLSCFIGANLQTGTCQTSFDKTRLHNE